MQTEVPWGTCSSLDSGEAKGPGASDLGLVLEEHLECRCGRNGGARGSQRGGLGPCWQQGVPELKEASD